MDDDLLRARLRAVEVPVEPRVAFVDDLHDQLAARLGFAGASTVDVLPRRRTRAMQRRRWLLLAATVALIVALLGNIAGVGSLIRRTITGPSLEETVRSSGLMRIAVRPDGPQVIAPGGVLQGFDIDVANALAARLGVTAELVVLPADEMFTPGHREWQVGLPGTPSAGPEGYVATEAYYRWPVFALEAADAATTGSIGGLAGQTVCVVRGSAGERWLDPTVDDGSLVIAVAAPAPVVIRPLADDDACLADMAAGGSSAMVTDELLASDVPTIPRVGLAGQGAVAVEPRAFLVPAGLAGAEAFADVLDRALAGMKADGTLGELSKRRFGGNDLTSRAP